jgi:hypothetical protein
MAVKEPKDEQVLLSRRHFLANTANGVGLLALASMLQQDGLLAADKPGAATADAGLDPLAPKAPHFAPKAKSCIFIYLEGAPSQIDLFDPKPKLRELHGQKLPDSFTQSVRFAFIQKETAAILGSPREFKRYGRCGLDLADLLPHLGSCADEIALIRSMHTDQFNHHPGQLMMNTGFPIFGRPSVGAWLTYGLGTASKNLPGFVVLTCGRGTSGGATNWSSGFLPSSHAGVLFRNQGDPVLNLSNPAGVTAEMQRKSLDAVRDLNRERLGKLGDPEIASRIGAYELSFRMQAATPELMDLSGESRQTLEMYGVGRDEGGLKSVRGGGGPGAFNAFSTNCLLARRLVERGVRCVNLFHASWDHHSDLDNELLFCTRMADQPVAALLKDLKQRGLLESTLVVWASELGRTPLGENRRGFEKVSGRDHHPFAFSIWMAGGGIKGGQVIGKTDEIGWNIVEEPIHVNDLHATLLHLFGMDHTRLTYRFQGRDFRLTDVAGNVVTKLIA